MHLGKSTASDFERRASTRTSRRISVQGRERDTVMDDGDSDLDFAAMAVSDGFRPRESQRPHLPQPRSSSSSRTTQRAPSIASAASSSTPDLRPSVSTSENAKAPTLSDGVAGAEAAPTSERTSLPPQRPLSIAKLPTSHGAVGRIREMCARETTGSRISEPYFGQETPQRGPTGPSHPYGMYTQNVRATRTASIATASTNPMSESSFAVSRGPAHPYGMYPQATVDETTVAPAEAMPVGFPGMGGHYQRRIGPDGEDAADIIGPDGHTEQLPPYTRYPDEAYARKVRDADQQAVAPFPAVGAAVVDPPPAPPVASLRASVAGAGGIGLATRNPEFEPADDLDSPRSRHSSRSFGTDTSHQVINPTATDAVVSEKQATKKEKAQLWARRRLWGVVPYWAICLAIIILVIMVIVLGAVVGTITAQHSYKKSSKNQGGYHFDGVPTVTVTYDASPIPTPTGLPPLSTGIFSLPLMTNQVSDSCFNDTTQAQAWNCNIVLLAGMVMNVQQINNADAYSISLTCNQSLTISNNVYSYGEQPFELPDLTAMELVNDTMDPARGPAWFAMVHFNKTVVVPPSLLTATASSSTPTQLADRDLLSTLGNSMADLNRKGVAQPGDRPWICTWPDTFLEIFVYPEQDSSWDKATSTGSSTSTASTTSASSSLTTSNSDSAGGNAPHTSKDHTPTSTTNGATTTPISSFTPVETVAWDPLPPLYPKMIKIEERRIYRSPTPWCQQVEITSDGSPAQPVLDANGNDVIIYIDEIEPPPPGTAGGSQSSSTSNSVLQYRDTSGISNCGCMWLYT